MPTSVHIPKSLLEAVDRRARALRISRNRLIVRALEHELMQSSDWSPGFFEQLSAVDDKTAAAVDEMRAAIRAARISHGKFLWRFPLTARDKISSHSAHPPH